MRADHQPARPVDAAGPDGRLDGANGRAAHKPLDGGTRTPPAHRPLENRANDRPVSHSAHRPRLRRQVNEG